MRHWHPRWVGTRVGFRDLTALSFLMASAYGAGLMVLPVLLGSSTVEAHPYMAGHSHMAAVASPLTGILASGVHTLGYLGVTGVLAWAFYRKLGIAFLLKTSLNFDLVWGAALVTTGLFTLLT